MTRFKLALPLAIIVTLYASQAQAWFFIFPLPNLSKPPALQRIIDTLEKSIETKAIAYVSEDKAFGGKQWAWGHHTSGATQKETEEIAMRACENTLRNLRSQTVGGKALYEFGDKKCELHSFANPYVAPLPTSVPSPALGLKPGDSIETKLLELKVLREKNLITQEEHDQMRQNVLKSF
jgi:hypothetical protein